MECFTNNRTQHYWHENNNAGIVVKRFRTGKKIANVKFEPSSSSSPFWLDCNCRLERERDGECVCVSARAKKELCFLWAGPQHHLSVMIIKRHLKESLAELSSRDS